MGRTTIAQAYVSDDAPNAASAAARLPTTHPDVTVTLGESSAEISGPHSADELAHYWRVALLNARLIAGARTQRAAILGQLLA